MAERRAGCQQDVVCEVCEHACTCVLTRQPQAVDRGRQCHESGHHHSCHTPHQLQHGAAPRLLTRWVVHAWRGGQRMWRAGVIRKAQQSLSRRSVQRGRCSGGKGFGQPLC